MKILLLYVLAFSTIAADLQLDDIDLSEFSNITKEIQANFTHTAVSSAGTLGDKFGIDTGIVAGVTRSNELKKLAREIEPNADYAFLPHAAFLASASVPFGFTGEATVFPKREISGVSYESGSLALKWTFSKMWKSFIDNSIRMHYSRNKFTYSQIIQNDGTANLPVDSTISFTNTVTGISYLIGKNFGIFEPWIGAGYVNGKSEVNISASSSATIFDQTVTGSTSQTALGKNNGLHLFAGFELSLTIMNVGVECSRVFDVEKCTLKTSLSFGL